jgi:4-amino-4-deoxy-L-arabinose transferase-like glycosyltransferase
LTSKQISTLIFFVGFAAPMLAIHLPYLKLPFHWDEMGQFVPASLDLYKDGALVPYSTVPNVHPPGVMAILAGVWRISGVSILAARVTMLVIASLGVLFCFLLSIRLSRGHAGAPAFAAAVFLIASPLFYAQSMLVLLDMPAMTFTLAALLLFLDGRWAACAVVSTALVLMKETAITTPLIFGAWLWFREGRRREALYFLGPFVALAAWLVYLHHATGNWLGNAEFAQYNGMGSLQPLHILGAIFRRAWFLLTADGNFIGTIALFVGWRLLKGWEWALTAWVGAAQLFVVTIFGGAMLERYLLPVLPLFYIAVAAAASAYPASWRKVSHTAMVALLVLGWFWNPPYPFPSENNLAMVNFVRLEQDAANYLEAFAPERRIASVWPFTAAVSRPEFGYVQQPLKVVQLGGSGLTELASVDRSSYDILVVHTRETPFRFGVPRLDRTLRYLTLDVPPTDEQLRAGLGLVRVTSWERAGQSIAIYVHGE